MGDDKIKEALGKLDPNNDNHWTSDGSPRMETVRMLSGNGALTRDDIARVDQSFTRTSAREALSAAPAETQKTDDAPAGENVSTDTEDQIDDAAATAQKISEGDSYIATLKDRRDSITREIEEVQRELDALKTKHAAAGEADHLQNMATIQGYLQASQARREERAARASVDAAGRARVDRSDKEPVDQMLENRKRDSQGAARMIPK